MNINWKLRLQNKVTLISIITLVIAIIYQVLNMLEIIPNIDQQSALDIACRVVDVLALLGIVVDPTTQGISDSTQALTYEEPKIDSEKGE